MEQKDQKVSWVKKEKEPRKNILGGSEEWRECGGFGNAGKFS